MKKILMMVVVIMIASGAAVARRLAPESAANAIVVKSGSTFKVSYNREESSNVKVSIFNDHGQLVFSEVIHKVSSFVRPYNFSGLPEGRYTIEINDGNSKIIESVLHEKTRSEKHVKWVPVNGEDQKFVLSVSNKGTDVITVNIYDVWGNLKHTETQKITGDFAKVYNLKKISGSVLVEVADSKGNIKRFGN